MALNSKTVVNLLYVHTRIVVRMHLAGFPCHFANFTEYEKFNRFQQNNMVKNSARTLFCDTGGKVKQMENLKLHQISKRASQGKTFSEKSRFYIDILYLENIRGTCFLHFGGM
jgi:hypothetical protein